MNVEDYRQLRLLTDISSDRTLTQRRLAKKHGLALGLTNFLLRRLVKKGYVKIVNLQRNRLRYLLTPRGLAEKARLTYEYLDYSLALYRHMRTLLTQTLSGILGAGGTQVVLYGTGELAEIAFLAMQQRGLNVVAVVDEPRNGQTLFMNQPVGEPDALAARSFDWVVVASFRDRAKIVQQLCRIGVPPEKIVVVSGQGTVSELPRVPELGVLGGPEELAGAPVR